MTLTIQQLQAIEPERIWLELTPEDLKLAQPNPKIYSNQTSLYNAKLSQLCSNKFQNWLREREISSKVSFTPNELNTIWDVVSGGAIDVGEIRLVLIPTDNLDRDEFCIPQEWVDLPNWMGDYYLAVQVDSESGLMSIWGFASHQSIKERGEYTPGDRSYSLDGDLLVTNLDILWMAQDLALTERSIIPELPTLGLDEALVLIKQLSIPSPYSPRSKLNFSQWGAILNSPNLRSQLYQTRLQRASLDRSPAPSFRLWDWLQDEFTNAIASGWQTYIPAHGKARSQNTIERAKLIDLQLDLRRETVVLLIAVVPESNERMRVLVQVHPGVGSRCLPAQLQLSYLDDDGVVLRTVTARSNDDLIQLPSYTCPIGMAFNLELKLYNDRVIERFVV